MGEFTLGMWLSESKASETRSTDASSVRTRPRTRMRPIRSEPARPFKACHLKLRRILDFVVWIFLSFLSFCVAFNASAQPLAFPGALGFGANATGGRGGSVYHVTTLADSGPGSFRTAVSSGNRIVVFDVGGYISLLSAVSVKSSITIAGQTAPGGGIGFKGGEISFASSSNIICRYIRIRPGSDTASVNDDALSLYRAQNIICDHVSLEFAPWNNIDGVSDDWQNFPVTAITFQNCIIANPTYQQFGAHTESVSSTWSWFYNIFANSHNRNPLAKINTIFINNILYNYQAGYTTHTSTSFSHDIINNYFIFGPATTGDDTWFQIDNNQSIYYSGNLKDTDDDGSLSGSVTTPYWYQGVGTVLGSPWSPVTATIPTYSPNAAYRYAVSSAGTLPRDQLDDLVLSQVKTLGNGPTGTGVGTAGPDGNLYTSQAQTGLGNNGYGTINGGVPALDSDGDGMPDFWEQANASNPGVNDAMVIGPDGYAKVENYINWLAQPHAQTTTNTPVTVNLWQYTSGFTNASAVHLVGNATNGTVALSNAHFAVFTPTPGFIGMGGFQFSVSGNDGSAYTNGVSVAVSALQPPANLLWRGDGIANVWSTTVSNWLNGPNPDTFTTGDNVTFDDTGSNSPAINISGSIAPGAIAAVSDQDYTFSGGALIGGASLYKVGAGTLVLLTLNTFNGGTLINEGTVQLGDGVGINGSLSGNVTNNDTLIFANPSALSSSASISGSGTLTKIGAGTLTLSGNQSFTNSTSVSGGPVEFSGTPPLGNITNNTLVTFKGPGHAVCPGSISGPGAVVMNNSSGLLYLTGANSYTGGTTNTAGSLVLSNNAAAGTGPVIYQGGYVMVGGGVVITSDFSIPGSATTDLSMQGTNGAGIWAGNVVNLGSGASWRPGADTGGSLIFTGTANQGGRNFIVPRGSVTFASNAVISATGGATAFGRDTTGGNRSANVTLKDNAAVTLAVCSMGGNQAGGSVTLTLQNNALLSMGANLFNVHYVARSTAVTTLRLNGGTFLAGGFSKTNTTYTNIINFNGSVLKAGAASSSFLPAFNTQSAVVQAGGAKFDDNGFSITIAAPLIHDSTLGATPDGGLVKLGAGTLTLSGANTYTGGTLVSNGTLLIAGNNGPSAISINSAGTLAGTGSVGGTVSVNSGGTLAPGPGAGTLTINNNLVLNPGALLNFELGTVSDQVVVTGNLTLGGTLNVTNVAGFGTNTYLLITYSGTLAGMLPAIGAFPSGYVGVLNTNTPGQVKLVVQLPSAPPPMISGITVSGENLILSATGPTNGTVYVLSTANVSLPRSLWTRVMTNQFDGAGKFVFTSSINSGIAANFYCLQLP
jgi:autotransporter-associated beta strand protein